MDYRRNPIADRLRLALLIVCFANLTAPATAAELGTQQFLPAEQAFVPDAWADGDSITLAWQVAPGYYLYRHGFGVSHADDKLAAEFPAGEPKVDAYFGEVEIYRDQVFATLATSSFSNAEQVELTVRYQGCADAGLCYPPTERTLRVSLVP